jgi:osmotically-inducible protein OsmY
MSAIATAVGGRKSGFSDSEIHRFVIDELKWDSVIDETDVGVEVDDGIVTLTGIVGSYYEKKAAADAAHRVRGVLDVANDVQVKLTGDTTPLDSDIAREIRLTLKVNVLLREEAIRTTVSGGWVNLEGWVSTKVQRDHAEEVVHRIPGVRSVTNNLHVSPAAENPKVICEAIEEALERQAERTAERIDVTLTDGTVTLKGTVRSWAERRAALGSAGHAPGVRTVIDRLTVAD